MQANRKLLNKTAGIMPTGPLNNAGKINLKERKKLAKNLQAKNLMSKKLADTCLMLAHVDLSGSNPALSA